MDNSECGALDQKSVFGGGWMKKRYRYEDDDSLLALSPPDESSFLTLRFGPLHNKPVETMYDRINKELGLSLENPTGPVISEASVAPTKTKKEPAELLLGSKEIILENLVSHPHASDHIFIATGSANNSPTILRRLPFVPIIERSEEKESDSSFEPPEQPSFTPLALTPDNPEKVEDSCVARQDIDTLVRKARGGRPTRKISMNLAHTLDYNLLDSVRELKLDAPKPESSDPESITSGLPTFSAVPSVFDSAPLIFSSRNSTDRRRKTSAPPSLNPMLPETQKAHNYFFTGSLFSTVATSMSTLGSKDSSPAASHVDLPSVTSSELMETSSKAASLRSSPTRETESAGSSSLMKTTLQMEDKAREMAALESKPRMAKRRPRASALREMNFLAPQST